MSISHDEWVSYLRLADDLIARASQEELTILYAFNI